MTKYEIFTAVLESIMTHKNAKNESIFDVIHMGLSISNFDNGGSILEGYNELGGAIPSSITGLSNYSDFTDYWEVRETILFN